MRITFAMLLFLVGSCGSTAVAQGETDSAPQDVTIESPADGEDVERPFIVRGMAPPGCVLELRVDDQFHGVFRADAGGKFIIPVDVAATEVEVRVKDEDLGDRVAVAAGGVRDRVAPTTNGPADEVDDAAVADEAEEAVSPDVAITDDVPEPADEPSDEPTAQDSEPPGSVTQRDDLEDSIDPFGAADDIDPFEVADDAPEETATTQARRPLWGTQWNRWNFGVMTAQTLIGTLIGGGLGVSAFFFLGGETLIVQALIGGVGFGLLALTGTVIALGAGWGGKTAIWAPFVGALVGAMASAFFPPALLILPGLGATVGYHLASEPRYPSE